MNNIKGKKYEFTLGEINDELLFQSAICFAKEYLKSKMYWG